MQLNEAFGYLIMTDNQIFGNILRLITSSTVKKNLENFRTQWRMFLQSKKQKK